MKYILLFLISFNVFAQQQVILDKGQTAPFDGILSDSDQMKKYRTINEEKKLLDKEVIKLRDLNLTKDERMKLYKEEAADWKQQYRKEQVKGFWSKVGYFTLGVLVTGVAAKAAIEATR
jgi:hypothetical protein